MFFSKNEYKKVASCKLLSTLAISKNSTQAENSVVFCICTFGNLLNPDVQQMSYKKIIVLYIRVLGEIFAILKLVYSFLESWHFHANPL
jgi:hypothetical protein